MSQNIVTRVDATVVDYDYLFEELVETMVEEFKKSVDGIKGLLTETKDYVISQKDYIKATVKDLNDTYWKNVT